MWVTLRTAIGYDTGNSSYFTYTMRYRNHRGCAHYLLLIIGNTEGNKRNLPFYCRDWCNFWVTRLRDESLSHCNIVRKYMEIICGCVLFWFCLKYSVSANFCLKNQIGVVIFVTILIPLVNLLRFNPFYRSRLYANNWLNIKSTTP